MRQVIYSRVSTDKQLNDNQVHVLKEKYPSAEVVEETASGAKERPKLNELCATLCAGDILIVFALDRLGRRTSEVLALVEQLTARGVTLISAREGADFSTACGKLILSVLCSVAELERNIISERTKAGLAARKAAGVKLGRRATYPPETVAKALELRTKGLKLREISKIVNISVPRLSQILKSPRA